MGIAGRASSRMTDGHRLPRSGADPPPGALGRGRRGAVRRLAWYRFPNLSFQTDEPPRPEGPTAPAGTPRAGGRLRVGTPRQLDYCTHGLPAQLLPSTSWRG